MAFQRNASFASPRSFVRLLLGAAATVAIAVAALWLATSGDAASQPAFVDGPQALAVDRDFVPPASGFYIAVDCNVTTPGIQDVCSYPVDATDVEVAVVAGNANEASAVMGSFQFTLVTNEPVLDPRADIANPDFNESLGSLNCSFVPTTPDQNPDPLVAASFIGCLALNTADLVPFPPGEIELARVRYTASPGGAVLTMSSAILADEGGVDLVVCPPAQGCFGAGVAVGDSFGTLTPPPTITPTPTVTPTSVPQRTPSVTPSGGVTDVLGINSHVCLLAAVTLGGARPLDAASQCGSLTSQPFLQSIVKCLRDTTVDEFGQRNCFTMFDLLQVQPADLAPIDLDANQTSRGMIFTVFAFVDGDYPVLFETDRGQFLDATPSDEYLCFGPQQDPDCDTEPATLGDGVVAARLVIDPDDFYRGPGRVTVTQNNVSRVLDFTVVGPAHSIELTIVEGKDDILAGSNGCPSFPLPPAHVPTLSLAEIQALAMDGIDDDTKTVVFARAFDSDGTALTGALLRWTVPYETSFFSPAGPIAGAGFPQTPSFDLGAAGIGFPQIVCSKDQLGLYESTATFDTLNVSPNPDASATVRVNVVDALPTLTPAATDTPVPTATSTPSPTATRTATSTATDTPTPTATNTPTATSTPTATNTPTPTATSSSTATPQCLTWGQKISTVIGVLVRLGAEEGERRYKVRYDVDRDGVIEIEDALVALNAPTCRRGRR